MATGTVKTCDVCKIAIAGQYIEVEGTFYHAKCFKCQICGGSLLTVSGNYFCSHLVNSYLCALASFAFIRLRDIIITTKSCIAKNVIWTKMRRNAIIADFRLRRVRSV